MPQDGGKQAFRIGAGAGEFVGVADPGGLDLDQHFAGMGPFQVNLLDHQGLARTISNGGA